jgi:hypothetical protein
VNTEGHGVDKTGRDRETWGSIFGLLLLYYVSFIHSLTTVSFMLNVGR